MHLRFLRWLLAIVFALSVVVPAAGKTIVIEERFGSLKVQYSLSRLRLDLGRVVRQDVCAGYRKGTYPGSALRAGNTVKYIFYDAAKVHIMTLVYTKKDCT
ncbi:MAG: hypothetical protein U1E67_21500 [Hyphomicrobiales bacterium]